MTPEKRTAAFRWVSILAVVAVAVYLARDMRPGLFDWIVLISLVALVGIVQNLGIKTDYGEVTFMPVAGLMTYLALGRDTGLAAVTIGLLLGGAVRLLRIRQQPSQRDLPWWVRLAREWWPIGQVGISLLAADYTYRILDEPPPLTEIVSAQDMAPVIATPVFYLIVYNLQLAADLWLQGRKVLRTLIDNRRIVLPIQLLPLALAPFSAIALARLGLWAFILFEVILATVVIVVFYLMITQETLEQRVDQLNSFSSVNRALRTTLERDSLLETIFLQVANILKIRNLHIVLADLDQQGTDKAWRLALAVEDRKFVRRTDVPYRIDGLTGWMLKERLPLLAEPVSEAGTRLHITNLPAGRSWMGIPLVASGKTLGGMYTWLESDEQIDRTFNQDDLDLFLTIGAQSAVALENASLYDAARKQTTQLTRLNQISAVMNASLNPEKVLELVTESVIEMASCDKASIYLYQETTPEPVLILAHAQGFSPEHIIRSKDIAVPLSDSERKLVLQESKPVWVDNIQSSDAQLSAAALLLAKRESFSGYAYLPLRAQMRTIGMLAVYYHRNHAFQQSELELLETFANQAALAVTNARIYHTVDIQLAQRMEQIARMSDINQRLSATLDMSTIFNLIIDSAMEGSKADAGVLVLSGDPELGQTSGDVNMVAWRGFDPAFTTRMPHHVAEGVARQVLKNGQTILTSLDDPNSAGPRSQLCVPIVLDDKVIGALAVESERLNAFNDYDLTFASQLAVQAAVAIRNAQLYNHAQAVRDRLHAILDASNDGLVMLDPKGRIVMTNTRMGDFWTFARQNVTPRSTEQILADPLGGLGEGLGYGEGELSSLLGRYTRNPMLRPETDLYEVRGVSGQRQQRFVERTTTPVRDEQGNFIGLLLVFHDVTEQKELEEARENLTQLIVHDLRSPLQSVMGSMRLINQLVPEKTPEVVQATQVSERAVKKLLNLVNDLLDISSMESGKFTLHSSVESLSGILEDVSKSVVGLRDDASAVVKVETPPDLFADIDRDMIERVVLNVVDNALKHTKPGTLVTLRATLDKADSPSGKDMISVLVIDNGPGVPADFKEKIFDRFTQVPGQSSTQRRSTGLGLAFCRMAIESHGGKIWVDDNPEGGSIFHFTLPAVQPPDDHEELEEPEEPKKPDAEKVSAPKRTEGKDDKPGSSSGRSKPKSQSKQGKET